MRRSKMILIVDSWAWLALSEEPKIADKALNHIEDENNQIFTTLLNIYEVYYRIKEKTNHEEAVQYIESIKKMARIAQIDLEVTFLAGDVHLKEKLSVVDAFVYATAIKLNGIVLTGDPHFKGKKNVIFIG